MTATINVNDGHNVDYDGHMSMNATRYIDLDGQSKTFTYVYELRKEVKMVHSQRIAKLL